MFDTLNYPSFMLCTYSHPFSITILDIKCWSFHSVSYPVVLITILCNAGKPYKVKTANAMIEKCMSTIREGSWTLVMENILSTRSLVKTEFTKLE
jgi:hypothetical protein